MTPRLFVFVAHTGCLTLAVVLLAEAYLRAHTGEKIRLSGDVPTTPESADRTCVYKLNTFTAAPRYSARTNSSPPTLGTVWIGNSAFTVDKVANVAIASAAYYSEGDYSLLHHHTTATGLTPNIKCFYKVNNASDVAFQSKMSSFMTARAPSNISALFTNKATVDVCAAKLAHTSCSSTYRSAACLVIISPSAC